MSVLMNTEVDKLSVIYLKSSPDAKEISTDLYYQYLRLQMLILFLISCEWIKKNLIII